MPTTTLPEVGYRITIAGREIAYQLRRSKRRTIGLGVDQRGLRVGAPSRARLGDIEKLIRQHGQWVLDKLDHWQNRQPIPELAVVDGTPVFVAGMVLTVAIDPGRQRGYAIDRASRRLCLNGKQAAATALRAALQQEARAYFTERLAHYADRMGLPHPPLRLSSARTRWGSCNHRGCISLHWRLIQMPPSVIDYVVVHELAHIREMNHSPRFWSVVEEFCSDWRALRQELKQLGQTLPVF